MSIAGQNVFFIAILPLHRQPSTSGYATAMTDDALPSVEEEA
jgi:hypothetical protein